MAGQHFVLEWEHPVHQALRVRIMRDLRKHGVFAYALDVREYVMGEHFEGFTRRGIRLQREQVMWLRNALNEALAHWDTILV